MDGIASFSSKPTVNPLGKSLGANLCVEDKFIVADSILELSDAGVFLVNLVTARYVHIYQSFADILGLELHDIRNRGLHAVMARMNPDDRSVLENKVWPRFYKLLKGRCVNADEKLSFHFNYRSRHPEKGDIQCLVKIHIVENDYKGKPVLVAGLLTDISEFKNDINITAKVCLSHPLKGLKTLYMNTFAAVKPHSFTERELEIVKLLVRGYSSKDIGEELYISSQTVDKHRKNILNKYSKKNTRELIYFVTQQGWI